MLWKAKPMSAMGQKRLIAATWFAIAACVPATTAYVTFTQYTLVSSVLFLAIPVILAAICGCLIGCPILREGMVRDGSQARHRGFFVALSSYFLLCVGFMIVAAVRAGPEVFTRSPVLETMLQTTLLFVFGSTMFIPMDYTAQFALILATGSAAGWLLYLFRNHAERLMIPGALLILPSVGFVLWNLPNPYHLPMYPGASHVKEWAFEPVVSEHAEEKTLTFHTADPFDKVMEYYRQELPADGWILCTCSKDELIVNDPGKSYEVRVKRGNDRWNGEISIVVWHSTIFEFP